MNHIPTLRPDAALPLQFTDKQYEEFIVTVSEVPSLDLGAKLSKALNDVLSDGAFDALCRELNAYRPKDEPQWQTLFAKTGTIQDTVTSILNRIDNTRYIIGLTCVLLAFYYHKPSVLAWGAGFWQEILRVADNKQSIATELFRKYIEDNGNKKFDSALRFHLSKAYDALPHNSYGPLFVGTLFAALPDRPVTTFRNLPPPKGEPAEDKANTFRIEWLGRMNTALQLKARINTHMTGKDGSPLILFLPTYLGSRLDELFAYAAYLLKVKVSHPIEIPLPGPESCALFLGGPEDFIEAWIQGDPAEGSHTMEAIVAMQTMSPEEKEQMTDPTNQPLRLGNVLSLVIIWIQAEGVLTPTPDPPTAFDSTSSRTRGIRGFLGRILGAKPVPEMRQEMLWGRIQSALDQLRTSRLGYHYPQVIVAVAPYVVARDPSLDQGSATLNAMFFDLKQRLDELERFLETGESSSSLKIDFDLPVYVCTEARTKSLFRVLRDPDKRIQQDVFKGADFGLRARIAPELQALWDEEQAEREKAADGR